MTGAEYRLVELTGATAAALAQGAEDLFDHPFQPDCLAAFLEDANHLLYFAQAGGRPIGFASANVYLHPDKAPQMFINEVEVLESWRRQGIGRALVERLVDVARARGCDYAWLGTAPDNVGGNACFSSVPGAQDAGRFVLWEWALAP